MTNTKQYIESLVGAAIIPAGGEIDLSKFINGAPHPVHLLTEAALPYVTVEVDANGQSWLFWDAEQSPSQLGVSIVIPGNEGLPKPRVGSSSKQFQSVGGVGVVFSTGETIENLPPVGEGQLLISSSITAAAAGKLGLPVVAPLGQVKSRPNPEGKSLVVGCFGFGQ